MRRQLNQHQQIATETIAQETGGRAFYNTNALDAAMAKAIDEGSHYYALAYAPTNNKTDGRYRRIEVKLSNATTSSPTAAATTPINPRHANPPKRAAEDPLIPLVGFGMPNFDQITYEIQASPLQPQPAPDARRAGLNTEWKGPFTRFGVDLAVSLQNFSLDSAPDGVKHGRLEVILVAYDRTGKIINISKRTSRFALPPKDLPNSKPKGFPCISKSTSLPATSTSAPESTISTPATPVPSAFPWEQSPPRIARRNSSNPTVERVRRKQFVRMRSHKQKKSVPVSRNALECSSEVLRYALTGAGTGAVSGPAPPGPPISPTLKRTNRRMEIFSPSFAIACVIISPIVTLSSLM